VAGPPTNPTATIRICESGFAPTILLGRKSSC
jgi:hypothetical protein